MIDPVLLLVLAFLVLLAVGVPIAVALVASSFLTVMVATDIPPVIVVQRMYSAVDATFLLAVPFFLLAGDLMARSGMSFHIARLATIFVGRIRGGLGIASVGSCMLFAGVSGAAVADTAAIGSVTIPAMKKAGYGGDFAGALIATAGTIGVIIPPSIPFILYGVVGDISIAKLFLAGVIPGALIGLLLMLTVYIMARVRGYAAEPAVPLREIAQRLWFGIPALVMPVVILGGIISGMVTPTESAAVAVLYALGVGTIVYRSLRLRGIILSLRAAVRGTAWVMFLLAGASAFTWILTVENVPQRVAEWIGTATTNKVVFLLLVNVILLVAGIAIETIPGILIFVPILSPIAVEMGIDPVHFAVIFVVNMMIGTAAPPTAPTLFVASGIAGVSMTKLSVAVLPFIFTTAVALFIITYIPALSLWLPRLFN